MIEGAMHHQEYKILQYWAKEKKQILEIGSWYGASTRAMADVTSGVIYAVDNWKANEMYPTAAQNNGDYSFMQFCINNGDHIRSGKIIPIRMSSTNANWVFNMLGMKFDMVFIDGDHSYEAVKADIMGAKCNLAEGGILCGHDYPFPGVMRAVSELIPARGVQGTDIWYMA